MATAGLNEKQLKALADFKSQVTLLPRDDNDYDCLRFLRARQYDVAKSVEMYKAYVEWRAAENIDAILDVPFPVPDRRKWPHSYHGKDKFGRPVFIERTGAVDTKALVEKDKMTIDEIVRGHVRQQEFMYRLYEQYTQEDGKHIENGFTILDLEGCSLFKHLNGYARQFFGKMANAGQSYYPERMGKLVVVNAPRAFPMAWNFIKGFLDTNTQNKIEVLGGNSKARLLELIDAQNLPKRYGGECDCDAKGCFFHDPPLKYKGETEVQAAVEVVTGALYSIDLAVDADDEKVEGEEEYIEGAEGEEKLPK